MASERLRLRSVVVGSLSSLALVCGCSGDPSSKGANGGVQPFGSGSSTATPGSTASGKPVVIEGFGRAPGMAIGTGVPDDPGGTDDGNGTTAPPVASDPPPDSNDIPIPVFEATPPPVIIPCMGCVELSAIVDDINERSDFVFNAGGIQVTRIVWTILLPFNSDQLFIRSIVDGSDGPYTFMSANVFGALNTPVQFIHPFTGTATNIGIALGSAGAWTGDQRVSVFVDSVTLEGPNGVTRTFDTDAGGFAPRGTDRQPAVQFH